MVFMAIGTQKQQFTRFFELVEESKRLKKEELISQSGFTKYTSKRAKMLDFIPQNELENYIKDCDFVICHGGVGTIFTALRYEKKVLVIPRLKKYKEHQNDHQLEICKELEKEGYIIYLDENEDIDNKIKELNTKKFKKYMPDDRYLRVLKEVI